MRPSRGVFVAIAAAVSGCALVLGLEEHDFVEAAPDAADDAGLTDDADADAGGNDGESCSAPSCEGRCDNLVSSCGALVLGAACGSCAGGQICNGTSKTCECPSPCGASRCGDLANACDGSTSCGVCGADASCQESADGGVFDCQAGPCISPPQGETCDAGRCSTVTDRCGKAVSCGACSGQLCISSKCDCPPRDVQLNRHLSAAGLHCISVPGVPKATCGGNPFQKTIGRLYRDAAFGQSNLDTNLYRCTLASGATFLSADGNCEGATTTDKIFIGRCMRAVPDVCGAVPLRRLRNATGDYLETTDPNENPNGYTLKLIVCHLWAP